MHAAGGTFFIEVGLDDLRVHAGREHVASCGAERPRAVEADSETFANAPGLHPTVGAGQRQRMRVRRSTVYA